MKTIKDRIVNLKDVKQIDPSIFPKPDYTSISTKEHEVKVGDPIFIDFKDLHIDEDLNIARDDIDIDNSHVNSLESSFREGILTNEELGAVVDRGTDSPKRYSLKYSFHRTDALQNLGQIGHWYYPIQATDSQWIDICSVENEPTPTKKENKETSIIQAQVQQIKKGYLAYDEDVIRDRINTLYRFRDKTSKSRIVNGIMERLNIKPRFKSWTKAKIKRWRKDHCSKHFEIEGDYDEKAKMFGYTAQFGGLGRTFHSAEKKYAEYGICSYVNCFTGSITPDSNIQDQIKGIKEEYTQYRVQKAITYGQDIPFLKLGGLFPPTDSHEQKAFTSFNIQEIENEIKKRILNHKKHSLIYDTI